MVKIRWTELSVDDLKSIRDYIAQDSVRYADLECFSPVSVLCRFDTKSLAIRFMPYCHTLATIKNRLFK